jgi:hypothetical protein
MGHDWFGELAFCIGLGDEEFCCGLGRGGGTCSLLLEGWHDVREAGSIDIGVSKLEHTEA